MKKGFQTGSSSIFSGRSWAEYFWKGNSIRPAESLILCSRCFRKETPPCLPMAWVRLQNNLLQDCRQEPFGPILRVDSVGQNEIRTATGEKLTASRIVLACDAPMAARLLGREYSTPWHGVTCLYFAANKPPIDEPILVLNGEGSGVINNLSVPSLVAPNYAPAGQSLVSVTVLGTVEREQEIHHFAIRWSSNCGLVWPPSQRLAPT